MTPVLRILFLILILRYNFRIMYLFKQISPCGGEGSPHSATAIISSLRLSRESKSLRLTI
jgi:hypothetical protein